MDNLYIETKGNLLQFNELLYKYENSAKQEDLNDLKEKIKQKSFQIQSMLDQLDIYVTKEPPSRKYDAKIRVDQLKYDFQHYKAAFNTIQYKKDQRILEEKRREELLKSALNSKSTNPDQVQLNLGHEQSELRHHNRLARFHDEVDRMIYQGENVLNDIREQKSMLTAVRRKIMNVSNALGLSNTLIKMIERRNSSDKLILYGGMIFTLICMFLAVKYLI